MDNDLREAPFQETTMLEAALVCDLWLQFTSASDQKKQNITDNINGTHYIHDSNSIHEKHDPQTICTTYISIHNNVNNDEIGYF